MPMFKVTLEKRLFKPGDSRNPFTPVHIPMGATSELALRSWEFEAKDENEVRKLLKEAEAQKVSNVAGYRLRSIELLDDASGEREIG